MALAPKFAGHKLAGPSLGGQPHTLEIYLDYVCPFSAKLFDTFYTSVAPVISDPNGPYGTTTSKQLQVIFRHQIQPWHPSSTLTHEAALAVLRLAPDKFWDFSRELFERQTEYFDVAVVGENRNQTYLRLAALAAEAVGADSKAVYSLLEVKDVPGPNGELNAGNGVTTDLRLLIKTHQRIL